MRKSHDSGEPIAPGYWQLDSAYEARVISHAAVFNWPDDDRSSLRISHQGLPPIYYDESAFVTRELDLAFDADESDRRRRLLVENEVMQKAIQGLTSIAGQREPFREVTPAVAALFIAVIERINADKPPFSSERAVGSTAIADMLRIEQETIDDEIHLHRNISAPTV